MKILMLVIFLGFIGQVLSDCEIITHNGYSHCNQRGCYLHKIDQRCNECQRCSEENLKMDCHPRECRGLPFPQFCERPSENPVLTKMVEVSLDSPLLGNYSQHKDKWKVFFYNEEFGQDIHVRVGKVCAHEWEKDKSEWNTFQKVRLLCRSDSEVEFNFIADIKKSGDDDPKYYGFFTKTRIGSQISAVCIFTIRSITNVITQGGFMDPLATARGGEAVLTNDCIPHMRPGVCKPRNLTDWDIAFIRTHPLMYETVEASAVLLTVAGHITKVAYHEKIAIDGMAYTVFFIGTEEGRIFKYLETKNGQTNFLEEIAFKPGVGKILALELIKNESNLLVSSEEKDSFTIPLHRCTEMSNCSCHQDPYCAWDFMENKCKEFVKSERESYINQSAGVIVLCSRIRLAEPLVVTNCSLSPTSPPAIYGTKPTVKSDLVQSDNNASFNVLTIMLVIFICVIAIIGITVYACRQRIYKQYLQVSSMPPTFESTPTTIKVTSNSADWRINDCHPKKIQRCGRVVSCVFNNLSPMTEYIVKNDEMSKTVITEGPVVEVQPGSETTNSVKLNISGWDSNFSGSIMMSPQGNFNNREKTITCSTINVDGLVPNMKYTVKLRFSHSSNCSNIIEKTVNTINTKEESFRVESRDIGDFLVWDELNRNINHLTFEGCCFPSPAGPSTTALQDRCLPLGKLPVFAITHCKVLATMDVMGSMETWTVAKSVRDFRNRETLGCDEECSKPFSFLWSLSIIDRQSLGQKVALRQSLYRVYCEGLGLSQRDADVMYVIPHQGPDEKFLSPLREGVRDDKELKELLKAFHQTFCDLSQHKPNDWSLDCKVIYELIEALYKLHDDCPACKTIYRKVEHEWVCNGLNSSESVLQS